MKHCQTCGTEMTRSRYGYRCPKCGRAFRYTGPNGWIAYQPPRGRVAQAISVMDACGIPALIRADSGHGRITQKENGRVFGYTHPRMARRG